MSRVSFDRRVFVEEYQNVQIHGFCDASNTGYGACIYVRSYGERGHIDVKLLCAKSRVAPLKTVTIPRLELCGALLLARLYREVSETLKITPDKIILWCDSTIVLHWLKTPAHALKTYVSTRVVEIQELTGTGEWRHVRSEDNPADAISRSQLPGAFLRNRLWVAGPSWLTTGEAEWPNESIQIDKIPELRINKCLTATSNTFSLFERYSSFSKLRRIVAYCLRFRSANKHVGSLTAEEINEAERRIVRQLQTQFSEEIKLLKGQQPIIRGKLNGLNPFLDENGLIRVGGRLRKSNLTSAQKHPILIPNRHRLTDQIIREIHETHYHTGIQTTLYILRQKFWILDGRNQIRKVIRACTRCFRFRAQASQYKMGDLPSARVSQAVPFDNTGVDFCCPFYIKEKKHRNRTRIKVYVCIFICMSIKAVHLEVVNDLSSDGFIAAFQRFVARRGLPTHVYSDNGTNFVGANKQLKELYALFNSEKHKELLERFSSEHRVNWHFIPSMAPHFGGIWEATVKLFKHHFRRVIGDSLFTIEELSTFTTEIEGLLNSRPITSITSDPNGMIALTPAHYLIGKPITSLPEGELSHVPANRLSTWQHIAKVRQDFWSRWNLEYLNELQKRHKWTQDGPELQVGAVVLIKDKNQPCSQWALGKVKEVHPGEDGVIRVATIKTAAGEVKRTTKCICPFSTNDSVIFVVTMRHTLLYIDANANNPLTRVKDNVIKHQRFRDNCTSFEIHTYMYHS